MFSRLKITTNDESQFQTESSCIDGKKMTFVEFVAGLKNCPRYNNLPIGDIINDFVEVYTNALLQVKRKRGLMNSQQESPLNKQKLQMQCPSVPTVHNIMPIRTKNNLTISVVGPDTGNHKSATAVLVTARNEVDAYSKKSKKIKTARLLVNNKNQNNCKDIQSTSKYFSRPTPYGKICYE